MDKQVVLSGIRATGRLHLGNYLGAITNFVDLSRDESKQCYFFVANLHTLTTRIDPKEIQKDLLEIVLMYVAAGIDPERSIIFAQSSVPETCELTWLLSCLAIAADLERMPHFKEKKGKLEVDGEIVNAGILTYPVLMAADILGPKANIVPVGEDQLPHIELTRDIARRFNSTFGNLFPEPQALQTSAVRVPGLDGGGKMGKSDSNTIDLLDSPEVVSEKLRVAVTDTARKRRSDPGDPHVCNIYRFHEFFSGDATSNEVLLACPRAKIGCIDCKLMLGKNINIALAPIQEKHAVLSKNKNLASDILREGGQRARLVIAETVRVAKEMMGVPTY